MSADVDPLSYLAGRLTVALDALERRVDDAPRGFDSDVALVVLLLGRLWLAEHGVAPPAH